MGTVVVTVQANTRAEVEEVLAQLRTLGLVPLGSGRPFEVTGRHRWMIRTEPAPQEQVPAQQ